jgi:2,5-diketo-D-gluconate reductase A
VTAVPSTTLNNGVRIPQLGFGTFQIEPDQTAGAVLAAIKAGYRHIDTAQMYGNEKEVGQAVRESGLARDDIFVTTKLHNACHAYKDAITAFDQSLADMDFEYLDLFLIHWPLPDIGDFVETWKALEEIYSTGRAKSIGVSNFQPHHLLRLLRETTIVPAVNQIEVHPYLTQDNVRAFGAEHEIATEAWSPIAQGKVLDDPVIARIAHAHDRTAAQVTLRWHTQRGDVIFPKSVTPSRIKENFELFDFELDDVDMSSITALNRNERTGPDPDKFNMVS